MTMTTMINPDANGRKRASLNEQINRLDNMLDGLSEGLNEAVADAVKAAVGTAVKEAVQAVLTEVLNNPEIRARLHTSAPLANESLDSEVLRAPCSPTVGERLNGWWHRARACIVSLRTACAEPMRNLRTSASKASQWAREHLSALRLRCEAIRPFKYQLLTALGIGLIVAVVVCYAGPWIAAIVGGIGGFVTTLAVQAGIWLRKVLAINAEQAV
jgi:hypothetical protein